MNVVPDEVKYEIMAYREVSYFSLTVRNIKQFKALLSV